MPLGRYCELCGLRFETSKKYARQCPDCRHRRQVEGGKKTGLIIPFAIGQLSKSIAEIRQSITLLHSRVEKMESKASLNNLKELEVI